MRETPPRKRIWASSLGLQRISGLWVRGVPWANSFYFMSDIVGPRTPRPKAGTKVGSGEAAGGVCGRPPPSTFVPECMTDAERLGNLRRFQISLTSQSIRQHSWALMELLTGWAADRRAAYSRQEELHHKAQNFFNFFGWASSSFQGPNQKKLRNSDSWAMWLLSLSGTRPSAQKVQPQPKNRSFGYRESLLAG